MQELRVKGVTEVDELKPVRHIDTDARLEPRNLFRARNLYTEPLALAALWLQGVHARTSHI